MYLSDMYMCIKIYWYEVIPFLFQLKQKVKIRIKYIVKAYIQRETIQLRTFTLYLDKDKRRLSLQTLVLQCQNLVELCIFLVMLSLPRNKKVWYMHLNSSTKTNFVLFKEKIASICIQNLLNMFTLYAMGYGSVFLREMTS